MEKDPCQDFKKRKIAAVWLQKWKAYEQLGNRENAIESYETSLQSDPEFKRSAWEEQARYHMGKALGYVD